MLHRTVSNFQQIDVVDVITVRCYRVCKLALKVGLALSSHIVVLFTKLFDFISIVVSVLIYLLAGNAVFPNNAGLRVGKSNSVGEFSVNRCSCINGTELIAENGEDNFLVVVGTLWADIVLDTSGKFETLV